VLEVGMIDFVGGPATWLFPTEAQAIAYIQQIVPRMRTTPWIAGFVWYPMTVSQTIIDQNAGWLNIRLTDLSGNLTNVGKAYRDAIQIRQSTGAPDKAANDNSASWPAFYALAPNRERRRLRRMRRAA
jgi:hypothetical protein